jgi:hypothetical protein
MTRRINLLILSTLVLAAQAHLRAQEVIVPAGTILQCTLTEPNLSSKTAEVDDPILCDSGPIHEFGVSVFPHGAYLGGRLAEYRDPGHLWGKGWLQLNFDRILLPGAEIPLSTKVISAPRLKVDPQGRIRGRGNARRDAIEWAIPVLWPEKILTLPMRGPRPVLKGETRLSLKLMQDISVPELDAGFTAYRPQLKPGLFRSSPERPEPGARTAISTFPERITQQPVSMLATMRQTVTAASESRHDRRIELDPQLEQDPGLEKITFLILKDGSGRLVTDYWFESGRRIRFVSVDGTPGLLPIGVLDLQRTVKLNRERGIQFVVETKEAEN